MSGRRKRLGVTKKTSTWDLTPTPTRASPWHAQDRSTSASRKLPPLPPRGRVFDADFSDFDRHRFAFTIDSSHCFPSSAVTTPGPSPSPSPPPSVRLKPMGKRPLPEYSQCTDSQSHVSSRASTAVGSLRLPSPSQSPSPSPLRDSPSPALQLSRFMKREMSMLDSGSTLPSIPSGPAKTDTHPVSRLLKRRLGDTSENKPLVVATRDNRPGKVIRLLEEEKIFDLYEWKEVLQEAGDGGKVVVCRPKDDKAAEEKLDEEEYVLKMCSKKHLRTEKVEQQFRHVQQRLLAIPPHPGVLVPERVHEDGSYYYMVMKRAQGGTLFDSLLTKFGDGVIPGGVVKSAMKQILEAMAHIHAHGLLHRDIKPDNIVVHDDKIMLIDFDHADPTWDPDNPKTTSAFYGTFRFSAPEVFLGEYSAQSDLYSVGCSLYLLMTGKFPRSDDLFKPCFDKGLRGWRDVVYQNLVGAPEVDWECDPWSSVPACRDLCQMLLQFDPTHRPESAEDALRHAWFAEDVI